MVLFTLLIITKICEYLGRIHSFSAIVLLLYTVHPSMSVYDRYNKFCLKYLDIKNPSQNQPWC